MRGNQKATITIGLLFLAAVSAAIFLSQPSEAKVSGVCNNCHTMHNSQNGSNMVDDPVAGAAGGGDCQGCHNEARENLLRLTCIGCHAKSTVGPNISADGLNIPQVFYSTGNELAAGNFKHVAVNGDASGHNVHGWGLGTAGTDRIRGDQDILDGPPGYNEDMDPSPFSMTSMPGGLGPGSQVFCAGAYGCHGNRNVESQTEATYGTHHADDTVMKFTSDPTNQGLTPGTSYRFLSGVKGYEDADWEATVGPTDHNEYYGVDIATRSSQASVETMSQFCASCHGVFHMAGQVDGTGIDQGTLSGPWIRHPTDVLIPIAAPYSSYTSYMYTGNGYDQQTVRVARSDLTAVQAGASGSTRITDGEAVVFCLSCHKAHASEFPDMLRFSYSTMTTLTLDPSVAGTGCFACHNDKDGI